MERHKGEFSNIAVGEYFSLEIRRALHENNAPSLIEAVRQAPDNETLQTIGLRFLLRDFWKLREADLAYVAEENDQSLEEKVKVMFRAMDKDLEQLAGKEKGTNDEQAEQAVARQRHAAVVTELEGLEAAAGIAFMNDFSQLGGALLSTPEELLLWAMEWRDAIVSQLWTVVQDEREGENRSGQTDATIRTVRAHLEKLIQGTAYPFNAT